VLGFLSNDFNQAGSEEEIEACNEQYAVSFQQFDVDHIKGATNQPVFSWLQSQQNPGPASTLVPQWNFHKYLLSKDGQLVATWDTYVYPGDDPLNPNDSFETNAIVIAIEAELAKP